MTYELAIADKAGVFIYVFTVYLDMLLMLMLLHSRFDEREHHATTFFSWDIRKYPTINASRQDS